MACPQDPGTQFGVSELTRVPFQPLNCPAFPVAVSAMSARSRVSSLSHRVLDLSLGGLGYVRRPPPRFLARRRSKRGCQSLRCHTIGDCSLLFQLYMRTGQNKIPLKAQIRQVFVGW